MTERDTALRLGSGGLEVLATPRLAAWMENAAYELLQKSLDEGKTSVGIRLELEHTAPTPVGMKVRVTAEVLAANGKTVDFKVTARDEAGPVGSGLHRRAIVDTARFMAKCQKKLSQPDA